VILRSVQFLIGLGANAHQFTVTVKVCEWRTPFEVPMIVKA
jgi:hypothetical protein